MYSEIIKLQRHLKSWIKVLF